MTEIFCYEMPKCWIWAKGWEMREWKGLGRGRKRRGEGKVEGTGRKGREGPPNISPIRRPLHIRESFSEAGLQYCVQI